MNKLCEKIAVEKVVLNLKGKSVELSVEDARRLLSELENLLGVNRPTWIPPQIVYIDRVPQPSYPSPWTPMCIGTGDPIPENPISICGTEPRIMAGFTGQLSN